MVPATQQMAGGAGAGFLPYCQLQNVQVAKLKKPAGCKTVGSGNYRIDPAFKPDRYRNRGS